MANINPRLQQIAGDLFIKYNSTERDYINKKIENIKTKLNAYFGTSIKEIVVFGSYKRDTILPRKFDEKSDIDILVVFNNSQNEYNPETYRTQLKRFTEAKYPTSTVIKDHPSVVLELNKIKFDLVPCRIVDNFFSSSFQIPDKNGSWMNTDPTDFKCQINSSEYYI